MKKGKKGGGGRQSRCWSNPLEAQDFQHASTYTHLTPEAMAFTYFEGLGRTSPTHLLPFHPLIRTCCALPQASILAMLPPVPAGW